jgi:hypothetical protein
VVALTLGLLAGLTLQGSADEKKADPKYTIKEVMKEAHAGKASLLKKVVGGKADKDEKQKLVDLYTALGQNKPPKGEAKDWTDKTKEMLSLAKDVAAGKDGAGEKLGKAVNCMECHKAFRK